jgi:hypothetical protein
MTLRRKELVTLTFKGSRYEDHGIDLDSIAELLAYKRILVTTATGLWFQKNSKAKTLPKDFNENLCIKFYEIQNSSTEIPLVRIHDIDEQYLIKDLPDDEFDEAASLIAQVTRAISDNSTLPEKFPMQALPAFKSFGKTLREDEWIEQKLPTWNEPVSYTPMTRNIISRWVDESYQDLIEKTGEVRSINLDKQIFGLALPDGSKINVKYSEEHESTIINALSEHLSKRLSIKGRAEHKGSEGTPKKIIAIEELRLFEPDDDNDDLFDRPIWDVIAEIGDSIPKEEWDKVPDDLSINLDHYLYGAPKDEE